MHHSKMISLEVLGAIGPWWEERKDRGANWQVVQLTPFLYTILDSLYYNTRKLPFQPLLNGASHNKIDTPDGYTIGIWLRPEDYSTLRVILALMGDLRDTLEKIQSLKGLLELGPSISAMYKEADKFKHARDFFTHMDEVWRDPKKHGIDGPLMVADAIEFTINAKNRSYLILNDATIYFSWDRKPHEIKIEKHRFDQVFTLARQLFAEITNTNASKDNEDTLPIERVYPL